MEKLIEFVGNNYAWFLTVTIILLFALIGYIYDTKKTKNDLLKKSEDEMNEMVELTDASILNGGNNQINPNFTAVQEEPITNINAVENNNVMNTTENVNNVAQQNVTPQNPVNPINNNQ